MSRYTVLRAAFVLATTLTVGCQAVLDLLAQGSGKGASGSGSRSFLSLSCPKKDLAVTTENQVAAIRSWIRGDWQSSKDIAKGAAGLMSAFGPPPTSSSSKYRTAAGDVGVLQVPTVPSGVLAMLPAALQNVSLLPIRPLGYSVQEILPVGNPPGSLGEIEMNDATRQLERWLIRSGSKELELRFAFTGRGQAARTASVSLARSPDRTTGSLELGVDAGAWKSFADSRGGMEIAFNEFPVPTSIGKAWLDARITFGAGGGKLGFKIDADEFQVPGDSLFPAGPPCFQSSPPALVTCRSYHSQSDRVKLPYHAQVSTQTSRNQGSGEFKLREPGGSKFELGGTMSYDYCNEDSLEAVGRQTWKVTSTVTGDTLYPTGFATLQQIENEALQIKSDKFSMVPGTIENSYISCLPTVKFRDAAGKELATLRYLKDGDKIRSVGITYADGTDDEFLYSEILADLPMLTTKKELPCTGATPTPGPAGGSGSGGSGGSSGSSGATPTTGPAGGSGSSGG